MKLKFSVMGNWGVSAGNNLRLTGYGDGLNGGINGKYFVDKVTHKYTKSGGFVTSFECSGIFDPFHYWDVGGHIEYHQSEDSSSESYNSAYETTSPGGQCGQRGGGRNGGRGGDADQGTVLLHKRCPEAELLQERHILFL